MISISILTSKGTAIHLISYSVDLSRFTPLVTVCSCHHNARAAASDVTVTSTWNWSIILLIMFNFLHRPIVSLQKTSICHQQPRALILTLQMAVAIDLHFMKHKGPPFQGQIFFTVLLKKKVTYILNGLRVSKLTAFFCFWVNYTFNLHFKTPQCHCIRKQISSSHV